MNKHIRYLITITIIILVWFLAADTIDNTMILPSPMAVIMIMTNQITDITFYNSIMMTLMRMLIGLVLAALCGILLGLLTSLKPWVDDLFTPIATMIKTIPNISYIIIVLLWFSAHQSVIVIVFLILFPLFFEATKTGIRSIRASLMDVLTLYSETLFNKIKNVYIPSMLPYVLSNLSVSLNLGFKVAIMAEVLGQPAIGIGRQMLLGKLTLDMAVLFAWTVWIVVFGLIFDRLISRLITFINDQFLSH